VSLTGTWYNELNSKLVVNSASGGQLYGSYYSAVGQAQYIYPVVGQYNPAPLPSGGQAMSWTVVWNNAYGNSHSTTAWSGQFQKNDAGDEEIYTLWLLASEVQSSDQDWGSTQVGQDTFTRNPPAAATLARALRRGHASHPTPAFPDHPRKPSP
jgi:hypothetical protein